MYTRYENLNFILNNSRDDKNHNGEVSVNEKYQTLSDFLKFIDSLTKSKINFVHDEMISKNLNNFTQLIGYIAKMFFSLYFDFDNSRRENLIECVSKFLIKTKKIEILNLILSYLQFINEIRQAIKFDYLKNCDFDFEEDILIKLENNNDSSNDSEIFKIRLNLYNDDEDRNNYLKSVIKKTIKFNESSIFFNYQLLSDVKERNIIDISKKSDVINFNKIDIRNIFLRKNSGGEECERYKEDNEIKVDTSSDKNNIKQSRLRDSLLFLEKDIANQIKLTKRNTACFKRAFEDFKIFLRKNLKSYMEHIDCLVPFGSVTQFSYNVRSDLEITIFTLEPFNSDLMKEIHCILSNNTAHYSNVDLRNTKRTKLLNFVDISNNVKIELMLNNYLGVLNSHLIRSYSLIDSKCTILINTIKDWSKSRNINGNFDGYLSSYCYTLMAVYFLQNLNRPILPVLQTNDYDRYEKNEIDVVSQNSNENFHFYLNFDDEAYTKYLSKCETYISENKSTLAEILLQFFIFYFYLFDENEYCIDISTRCSVYRYNQIKYLNYHNNKQFSYCFIDPFDYSYNPGSYMTRNSYQEEKFRKEMENAIKNIVEYKSIF